MNCLINLKDLCSGDIMVRCDKCKRIIEPNKGPDNCVNMISGNYTCRKCYELWNKYYDANDIDNKDYEEEYFKWLNKNKAFVFR